MFPIQDSVPRRCVPVMTWSIIAINVLVFLVEVQLPPKLLEHLFYLYGIVPARYTNPDWANWAGLAPGAILPLFTSMFLHGGWIHIIGNMWTLWIFGDNVEDEMGPWRFLFFYLLCGLFAAGVQIYTNMHSTLPTIGASGAIAGVMGAYYFLFPRARIIIMVPIFIFPFFFEIPAIFFLAFWFFEQVFSGALSLVSPTAAGGIAWWAHIGGFTSGMLLHTMFKNRRWRCRKKFKDQDHPWGLVPPGERY